VAGAAAALTLTTVGQTVGPLRHLAFFAPRRPDRGPQGVPVNRAAIEAGVVDRATASSYRLDVEGAVTRPLSLTLSDLQGLAQREATLPISCVEGWSATARWRGVGVGDLLALAGVGERRDVEVEVHSLEEGGAYNRSVLNHWHARDRDTLLALELGGEPLHLDHGFPLRLIGPNRPGVHQTKWVTRLVVR
jgi:DMSO/TMAO reductase YedYZ molybdopterin-dependent catalytic subunit